MASCAPTRFVRPLERGEKAIIASLGGPVVQVPNVAPIPLPLTSVGYAQGVTRKTTAFGVLHTTDLVFGIGKIEAGLNTYLYQADRWGVTATPVLNFAIDKWEWNAKLWPQADFNVYYSFPFESLLDQNNHTESFYSKELLVYGGVNNWFELAGTRAHGEDQPKNWILSPHVGVEFQTPKWNYQFETKLLAPGVPNRDLTISYSSILKDKGALGIYFGFKRKF